MKKPNFIYPDETIGSKLAREIRDEANRLTDKQREEHFRRGMHKIYGAGLKPAVVAVAGH